MQTRQISNEEVVMANDGEHPVYDVVGGYPLLTPDHEVDKVIILLDIDDNSFWAATGKYVDGDPWLSDSYDYGGSIVEIECPFE